MTRVDPLVHRDDAIAIAVSRDSGSVPRFEAAASDAVGDAANQEAAQQYQDQLKRIINDVLDDLPAGTKQPSSAQLRSALSKALKPDPRLSYSLNAQTGKLSLKLKLTHGEIEAEPNIYAIARKVIFLTAVGSGITDRKELVSLAKAYFRPKPKLQSFNTAKPESE